MKDDLKKRFMDILFDPAEEDEEEVIAEGKVEEITPSKNQDKLLNAKDILYHRSGDNASAFIDLEETTTNIFETNISELTHPKYEEEDESYELQPTISPIFGVVRKASNPEPILENTEVDESIVKKPATNHLGTVISPFYGYAEMQEEQERENTQEISIKRITSEERSEYPAVEEKPVETLAFKSEEEVENTKEDIKLVFNEEEKNFENQTLEDILEGFKDKTMVSDREINLFDDLFKEDK